MLSLGLIKIKIKIDSETVMLMKTSEETEVALDILDSVDEDEENSEVKEVS